MSASTNTGVVLALRALPTAPIGHLGHARMIDGRNDRVPWRLVMLTRRLRWRRRRGRFRERCAPTRRRIVTLCCSAPGIAPFVVESLDSTNPRSTRGAAASTPWNHPQVQQESAIWAGRDSASNALGRVRGVADTDAQQLASG